MQCKKKCINECTNGNMYTNAIRLSAYAYELIRERLQLHVSHDFYI